MNGSDTRKFESRPQRNWPRSRPEKYHSNTQGSLWVENIRWLSLMSPLLCHGPFTFFLKPSTWPNPTIISLFVSSSFFLGIGELSLESLLCGETAIASQHRDQSHDLRPLSDAPSYQYGGQEGKQPCCFCCEVEDAERSWFWKLIFQVSFSVMSLPFHLEVESQNLGLLPTHIIMSKLCFLSLAGHASNYFVPPGGCQRPHPLVPHEGQKAVFLPKHITLGKSLLSETSLLGFLLTWTKWQHNFFNKSKTQTFIILEGKTNKNHLRWFIRKSIINLPRGILLAKNPSFCTGMLSCALSFSHHHPFSLTHTPMMCSALIRGRAWHPWGLLVTGF